MRAEAARHVRYAMISHVAESGEHRRFRHHYNQLGIAGGPRRWHRALSWRGIGLIVSIIAVFGVVLEVCR
jgi:hypothetical protein